MRVARFTFNTLGHDKVFNSLSNEDVAVLYALIKAYCYYYGIQSLTDDQQSRDIVYLAWDFYTSHTRQEIEAEIYECKRYFKSFV